MAAGDVTRCPFGWHPNAPFEEFFWDPAVDPGEPHSYCALTADPVLAAQLVAARAEARPRPEGYDDEPDSHDLLQ